MSLVPRRPPSIRAFALPLAALLALASAAMTGCGRGGSYEITEVRERTDDGPPAPMATLVQRFRPVRLTGGDDPHAGMARGPAPVAGAPPATPAGFDPTLAPFGWSAPPEWVRQPARSMRVATFVPAGAPKTEVYVTLLTGRAGGARLNLDRWRGQMGGSPLTDAEFQALPRTTILGGTAILLTADGAYTGMSGAESSGGAGGGSGEGAGGGAGAGQRLVAMLLERPKDMITVKMTGPAEEVRAEEGRFKAFCESFHE